MHVNIYKKYKNNLVYALTENPRVGKEVYFVPVADGRRERRLGEQVQVCSLSYKDRPEKVWEQSHYFYNDLLSANQH